MTTSQATSVHVVDETTTDDTAEAMLPPRELAASYGMIRVGGRPPLARYTVETLRRLGFPWNHAKATFRVDTSRTKLGFLWAALNPLLQILVYGTIFYYIMPNSSRPANYVAFLVVGLTVFQFILNGMTSGARAIMANEGLIRSIRFPRALLPISVVLHNLLDLVPTILMILPVILLSGESVHLRWLLVLPALALATLFSLGLAYTFAWITSYSKDVLQLLPYISRTLFYCSGVFYSVYQVDYGGWVQTLMIHNPFGWFMTLARSALIVDPEVTDPVTGALWLQATIVSVIMLVVGYLLFWLGEKRYGRE